jgi:hypothetical protein
MLELLAPVYSKAKEYKKAVQHIVKMQGLLGDLQVGHLDTSAAGQTRAYRLILAVARGCTGAGGVPACWALVSKRCSSASQVSRDNQAYGSERREAPAVRLTHE